MPRRSRERSRERFDQLLTDWQRLSLEDLEEHSLDDEGSRTEGSRTEGSRTEGSRTEGSRTEGSRTRATIWAATLLIFVSLLLYGCGPEALCILDDGTPASNAFGARWCERDGLPGPSRGDVGLAW